MPTPRSNSWRDRTRQKTTDSSVLVARLIALLSLGLITMSLMSPTWITAQKAERSAQADDDSLAALDDESEANVVSNSDNSSLGLDFGVNDRN